MNFILPASAMKMTDKQILALVEQLAQKSNQSKSDFQLSKDGKHLIEYPPNDGESIYWTLSTARAGNDCTEVVLTC